jgi:hypothetical protein
MAAPRWVKRLWPWHVFRQTHGWPDITPPTVPPDAPPKFEDRQGADNPTKPPMER